jgi:hypothetical protein
VGAGGGYILAPSDHFFDADPELVKAFAGEAQQCLHSPLGAYRPGMAVDMLVGLCVG